MLCTALRARGRKCPLHFKVSRRLFLIFRSSQRTSVYFSPIRAKFETRSQNLVCNENCAEDGKTDPAKLDIAKKSDMVHSDRHSILCGHNFICDVVWLWPQHKICSTSVIVQSSVEVQFRCDVVVVIVGVGMSVYNWRIFDAWKKCVSRPTSRHSSFFIDSYLRR